jgi:Tannase and feruloyl esterase
MPIRKFPAALAAALLVLTFGASVLAAQAAPAAPPNRCAALAGTKIPARMIGLPTTGATIASAKVEKIAGGDKTMCVVLGAIAPVHRGSPSIDFEVNLPADWNGKAIQAGGGGYDGNLVDGLHLSFLPPSDNPLAKGYVTFGSDSGHQGTGNRFATTGDASFAMNAEALANFGGDQLKKVHDVAVTLMKRYYGRPPSFMYFIGNSEGGHEAMTVTQRFPSDYNGAVAIHPAYDLTAIQLDGAELGQRLYGPHGAWLSPAKTSLIASAVLKACDGLDGLEDGVISNLAACRTAFDVETLRCPSGRDEGPTCLSDAQIAIAKFIASPVSFGFSVSGVTGFPGWPIFEGALGPGSFFGLGTRPVAAVRPAITQDAFAWVMADQAVRYMFVRDPSFNSLNFDPMRYRAHIQQVSRIIDDSSPDLDAFRKRGGKLLLMHGTVDMAIAPGNTINYYERLKKRYGAGLDNFVRFYIAPGFGHGDGPFRVTWDSLNTLDRWVVDHQPPGPQIVTDSTPDHHGRSRPLCEYPDWPKYRGGDPNSAQSFVCVSH